MLRIKNNTNQLKHPVWKWTNVKKKIRVRLKTKTKFHIRFTVWEWDALLTFKKSLWGQKDVWLKVWERRQTSLLVLLVVCDGGHGPLAFVDVTDTSPLSVHWLLPQGHLCAKVIWKHSKWRAFQFWLNNPYKNTSRLDVKFTVNITVI